MAEPSQLVPKCDETVVTLVGGPSDKPYNRFKTKADAQGNRTLVDPKTLGLNEAWIRPPETATEAEKEYFPYWGHRISKHIEDFNAKSRDRRRVFVYDLRHGKADHNQWKEIKGKEWGEGGEIRKEPILVHDDGNEYCNIDPPLTGEGKKQAIDANGFLKKLRQRGFPMPTTAYVSVLLRPVQTFDFTQEGMGIALEDAKVVEALREKETGNSADISFYEYTRGLKKPPAAGETCSWMEVDVKDEAGNTKNPQLERRVKELDQVLPRLSKSSCIIRVTHSLLNRYSLKNRAVDAAAEKVLDTFMLDEGGLFAYVVEYDIRAQIPRLNLGIMDFASYKRKMGWRRESAFKDLKYNEVTQLPVPTRVDIEQPIRRIANAAKATDDDKSADDKKRISQKIPGRKIPDRGSSADTRNIGARANVSSRMDVSTGSRTNIGSKKDVESKEIASSRRKASGKKRLDSTQNADSRRNMSAKKRVGSRSAGPA